MRVLCPACDSQYDVPDRLIGEGRRLRCARCGHDWMVHPPAPPSPAAVESPPRQPVAAVSAPPAGAGDGAVVGTLGLWLAWAASVGALVLLLAGLWLFRESLTRAWPPLARLYDLIG